jgi:SSS family solute:Na+ symporter
VNSKIYSFLIIFLYLIFMIVVTFLYKKKNRLKNVEGFFLANRGVSSILLPLTMIAGMQSTFAFLGGPGMYYNHGIPYMSLVLSQVWVALMVIYFGNKIRKLANKYGYMTIGDYFKDRYDSNYIKVLAALISVLMTMVFLAMQYVGNARAITIGTGGFISYEWAIIIGVVFSLIYVLVGGAGGVIMLDAIQAVVLMIGIVVAAVIATAPAGGIVNLFKTAAETTPELLARPGGKGMYTDAYWVMQFIVLPFGIWLCPHIWVKSLMAKDENALAKSAISVPVSQIIIFGFSALFIGLAGHQLLDDIGAADNVLPMMMTTYSNWVISALVMSAAISAGMSTINGMLLVCSQIVSQDLVLLNRKDKVSEETNMRISQAVVFILAVIAAIIALRPPQSLVQVVQDVAYTGLAQLAPAFILGLYWKDARKEGVILGMTAGIVILFVTRIMQVSPLGLPGFMWAFFTNLILIVVVSSILKSRDNSRVENRFFSNIAN